MSQSNDGSLRDEMKRIQQSRTKPKPDDPVQQEDRVEQTKSTLQPVLKEFVEGDRDLQIQSSDASGFFISYGYRHVCRVGIVTHEGETVDITMDTGHGLLVRVYHGPVRENEIKATVKASLLQWYKSLF